MIASLSRVIGNQKRFRSRITTKEFDYGRTLAICCTGLRKRHAIRFRAGRLTIKAVAEIRSALSLADRIASRQCTPKEVISMAKQKPKTKPKGKPKW